MTTVTPQLQKKIERRARRAWRYRENGDPRRFHRITDVTDDSLRYRPPAPGDYYGKKKLLVQREDGAIEIGGRRKGKGTDPMLDCLTKADVLQIEDHDGPVRAYKVTNASGQGIYRGGIKYEVGKTVKVDSPDTDPESNCHAGINLADLGWAKRYWQQDSYRIFALEFYAPDDLAAIPTSSDGKFRVAQADVVEELDLVQLGLKKPPEEKPGLLKRLLGKKGEAEDGDQV